MLDHVFTDAIGALRDAFEQARLERQAFEERFQSDVLLGDLMWQTSYGLPGEGNHPGSADITCSWPTWSRLRTAAGMSRSSPNRRASRSRSSSDASASPKHPTPAWCSIPPPSHHHRTRPLTRSGPRSSPFMALTSPIPSSPSRSATRARTSSTRIGSPTAAPRRRLRCARRLDRSHACVRGRCRPRRELGQPRRTRLRSRTGSLFH